MKDSREDAKTRRNVEELSALVEDCGVRVRRQVAVPIRPMGLAFDEGFRADLIVEDCLLIALKPVETLAPVHAKQVLTSLRLLHLPVGLLINVGAPTFKEGIRRIANGHSNFASSRLRVNQSGGGEESPC